ncbi:multidrug effflux MFS transporter [Tanticharoenia sakaeratensis]|uniref:Bcr/CflA family efflux transporter n=1 Tax=Tanticharoenia sakaeratensis NBRC 103193 TaxID=1231623 RepID=A0A0D6MMG2_9PROT|nr:multidrug effflux MFS transporter [Tanticharoenia sakaeratensis]GAN54857.1 drug resistance transporter, Bcr/CflA subfamily protein [Tanticharoenia sakaeratensis NBRC 103193]GBQ21358.1 multidrug ABC transporter [Tanticharoenia sakaeratensis NBRC 103193]
MASTAGTAPGAPGETAVADVAIRPGMTPPGMAPDDSSDHPPPPPADAGLSASGPPPGHDQDRTETHPRSAPSGPQIKGWLPLLLGFLTAVGPVSTDIYLPAFPDLERSFHSGTGSASMTLSAWMIGLALGQITMGPLSDRYGRRIPMLLGMVGYTVGSVGCAISTNIWEMCAFRLIAAISASSGIVIPSACVRDLSTGNASAKLMSKLILIQGVVPILAPMLGGLALSVVSWRAIFWASAIYGLLCCVLLWSIFPETLGRENRRELHPVHLIHRYLGIATTRSFLSNGLIWGFCGFLSFTYLTAAPTVFEHIFHLSPFHYGILFGVFAVCMIGASQINGMLVGHVEAPTMLTYALGFVVFGTLCLLAASIYSVEVTRHGHFAPILMLPIIICMMLALGPTGVIGPNAMVGALSEQSQYAGSASALAGTWQYALGSLASGIIGMLPAETPVPMAALMLFGAFAMLFFAFLRPKSETLPTPDPSVATPH